MSEKIADIENKFDDGLKLLSDVATLTIASLFALTASAPILPDNVKHQINQVIGGDLDASHEFWKSGVIKAVEGAQKTLQGFTGHPPKNKKTTANKCEADEKTIRIGNVIFTILVPNCS